MLLLPDYIIDKCVSFDTHILWNGPIAARGHPRMSHNGERVLVRRHLAEIWLQDTSGSKRIIPTCGISTCLLYEHSKVEKIRRRLPNQRFKEKRVTPEYARNANLFRNYGISIEEWNSLFESQGKVCALCGSTEKRGKNWHTDHDHRTGKVRGILCGWCNTGIGKLQEDPALFLKAISYLGGTE